MAVRAEIGENAWEAKAAIGLGWERKDPRASCLADDESRPVWEEAEAIGHREAGRDDPHRAVGADEADRAFGRL